MINFLKPMKYFQQGGAVPQQQDIQQQVVALVQAAMQGDQQAAQQVNQILEAAKQGDQQAMQIAQMIQQVVNQMKGQATQAKWGAKLSYIKSLKYAKGGKTCPECEKQAMIEKKACGGKKAKKKYFGGYL
jgi:N-acetylglucosamine kinase-like BadF-type ATPase